MRLSKRELEHLHPWDRDEILSGLAGPEPPPNQPSTPPKTEEGEEKEQPSDEEDSSWEFLLNVTRHYNPN